MRACSHAIACSSVCDWQAVRWLEWAVSPAVCSRLHMLGASGEELVDLLLAVTLPRLAGRATVQYWHTFPHVDRDAAGNAILIWFFAWVRQKMSEFRANTHRHKQSQWSGICMHSTTVKCRPHKKMWGKERRWAVEVALKEGGSLSLCHYAGAAAGLGFGRIYRESSTLEIWAFVLEVKSSNSSIHQSCLVLSLLWPWNCATGLTSVADLKQNVLHNKMAL